MGSIENITWLIWNLVGLQNFDMGSNTEINWIKNVFDSKLGQVDFSLL